MKDVEGERGEGRGEARDSVTIMALSVCLSVCELAVMATDRQDNCGSQ